MALTDDGNNGTGMVMPVAPMYGSNGGDMFGNGCGWWFILFLFAMFGGWGNGFGGGIGNFDGGLYPWMNQANQTNNGFRDQMLNSSIQDIQSAVTSGFGNVQLGIAGINQNLCQSFANAETAANARQMADMQQAFSSQIATMQGFNGVNSGVADLRYTVATEACADRAAVGDALQNVTMQNMGNTNAIVSAITAGIQSIKDDLCQDRLDAERRENQNLRSELMYARGQASQVEQTAQLLANNNAQTALFQQGFANEVDALYNRLSQCPVNTVPVAGNTPLFRCNPGFNGNGSCGCGSY